MKAKLIKKDLLSEKSFNKIDALKYLIEVWPKYAKYIDEWAEASMYDTLCDIINNPKESFNKDFLDDLLEKTF
jgi:hypothetical protein